MGGLKIGAINAALRFLALGSRFLLSVYMAKYMSLRDVGVLALLTGVTGMIPAIAGFGLNYFVARELVGLEHARVVRLIRERLSVTTIVSGICAAVIVALGTIGTIDLPISTLVAALIVIMETIGFDIQMALMARSKSSLGNLLLFFRTGAWVIPFILLSFAIPALRTIGCLAWFWLGGLAISHLLFAIIFRRDIAMLRKEPVMELGDMRRLLRRSGTIYLSDLGLAGSLYVDRFIISALISVKAAGIYFFFSSIANAVYVICLASTVQVYAPVLRATHMQRGATALTQALRDRLKNTILFSAATFVLAFGAVVVLVKVMKKPELAQNIGILPIILVAFCVRVGSELLSSGLSALEKDNQYAIYNISGLVLATSFCALLIPLFGLTGAALGMLLSVLIVFGMRAVNWRNSLPVSQSA